MHQAKYVLHRMAVPNLGGHDSQDRPSLEGAPAAWMVDTQYQVYESAARVLEAAHKCSQTVSSFTLLDPIIAYSLFEATRTVLWGQDNLFTYEDARRSAALRARPLLVAVIEQLHRMHLYFANIGPLVSSRLDAGFVGSELILDYQLQRFRTLLGASRDFSNIDVYVFSSVSVEIGIGLHLLKACCFAGQTR